LTSKLKCDIIVVDSGVLCRNTAAIDNHLKGDTEIMAEDNEEKGAESNTSEDGEPTVDSLKLKLAASEKQYKTLQRKVSRFQKQAESTINSEEVSARVDLVDQKLDKVLETFGQTGVLDDTVVNVINEMRNRGEDAVKQLKAESNAMRQIVGIEAEHDTDFEDDETAVAIWETGDYEKALAHFTQFVAKSEGNDEEVMKLAKLEAERMVREAGGVVNTSGPTGRAAGSLNTAAGIKSAMLEAQTKGDTKELIRLTAAFSKLPKQR